jgi:hypothetical protein
MTEREKYEKLYPEATKVDKYADTIRVVEEFAEYLRFKKEVDIDTPDIYAWLEIDYDKYQKEVDQMYHELKK